VLGDRARADGTALYLPPPPFADASSGGRRSAGRADDGLVVIAPGAELRGLLYSAADAEVEGRLLGTLLARRLAAYRSPTHYRNWLIGGEVDPSARPAPFLVPIGLGPQADRTFETVPAPPPVSPEAVLRHSNDPRPKDAV
jgi:hypothetical protein